MNSKLLILTRILLKNGTGLDIKIGKNKLNSQLILLIFIALCFAPMAITFGSLVNIIYDAFHPIDQQGVVLSLGTGITSFVIFFFGMFFIFSTFYFSGDIENLLPLPIKPSHIVGAKLLVAVIYEYFTELLVIGPILIVYGVKSSADILYYVYSVIVFLLLPIIPLIISALIVMVVMSFTSFGRNRDRLKFIGGIVAMFIAIAGNIAIQRFVQNTVDQENLMKMVMMGQNSLIKITSSIFPSSYFSAMSLANSANIQGILNLLLFVGITGLGLYVFLCLADIIYFKGVVGISESKSKRKKVTGEELDRATIENPTIKTYILKEIRILIRTPIYFMNCVLINFLWPVFLILPFLAQSSDTSQIEMLLELISSGKESVIFAVGFGFSVFLAASNGVAASSVSREGKNVFITKFIPISYISQITAKALTGAILSFSGVAVMLAILVFLLKISAMVTVFILLAAIAGILFVSFAGVMIDLINPKLNWDNEQKAVKQNMNVLFSLVLGLLVGLGSGFGIISAKLDLIPAFLLTTGIFGLLCVAVYNLLKTRGVKLFENINA